MSKNKRIFIIGIITFLILMLPIFKAYKAYNLTSVEKDLIYLTSDKCSGRLPGTAGNKLAGEYIMKQFKEMGLKEYTDSYYFKYNETVEERDKYSCDFVVQLSEGKSKKYSYGNDFLVRTAGNISLDTEVTFDANARNIKDLAVVVEKEDKESYRKLINKAKVILVHTNNFKLYPKAKNTEQIIIEINDEIYNTLKENEKAKLKLNAKYEEKKMELNNIVGKIIGANREDAIVISAHFDHMGKVGSNIFSGAIDNASGTATLIEVARNLTEYAKDNKLSKDIIFVAFNSEESGLVGSKAFCEKIASEYKSIYNINIDCIGIKDGGKLYIDGDEVIAKTLMQGLQEYFTKEKFDVESVTKKIGGSDHFSFLDKNIAAVNLIQNKLDSIHTTEDNMKIIDVEYLNNICKTIASFVISNNGKNYANKVEETNANIHIETEEEKKRNELFDKEYNTLKFNEYKFVDIQGEIEYVSKTSENFNNIAEVKKYYPSMNVKEDLSKCRLDNILVVNTRNMKVFEKKDYAIGKIYQDKADINNIENIRFDYIPKDAKDDIEKNMGKVRIYVTIYDKSNEDTTITPKNMIERTAHAKLGEDIIKQNGSEYKILLDEESNNICGVCVSKEYDNRIYSIFVRNPDTKEYQDCTKEKSLEYAEVINLKQYLDEVLSWYKK